MNQRNVLLRWSVALGFGVLLATCTTKDDFDATSAGQEHIFSANKLVAEHIRTRIEDAGVVTELRAGGEPVYASLVLPGFYERRRVEAGPQSRTSRR